MEFPNALIIGASRSGTTSCYNYLKQHPEVFMSPVKEARFFTYEGETVDFRGPADSYTINRNSVTDLDDYLALFNGRTTEPVAGEASPVYLYDPRTPGNIERHVPGCKLICILRNPVERAYSDFLNMIRHGWEPLRDFEEALRREEDRKARHFGPFYHYASKGFYGEQLERYLDRFSEKQLKILWFEDFKADPTAAMQDVYRFLEVDPEFQPEVQTVHNRSGVPRSEILHTLFTHPVSEAAFRGPLRPIRQSLRDANTRHEKPPFPDPLRNELRDRYRDDVAHLESLTGRDLSHWLGSV